MHTPALLASRSEAQPFRLYRQPSGASRRPARRSRCWASLAIVLTIAILGGSTTCLAQDAPDDAVLRVPFVRPDRHLLQRLDQARSLIADGLNADAIVCLGEVLESPVDYFVEPTAQGTAHSTLKAEARSLLRQLPPAARQLYELQYGAVARQQLRDAAARRDPDALAELVNHHFQTEAGYEAAMLLGLHLLDTGQYPTAAHILRRLQGEAGATQRFEPTLSLALAIAESRSGNSRASLATLRALRRRLSTDTLRIGGTPVPWFAEDDDPAVWLERITGPFDRPLSFVITEETDWTQHRGVPWRNASTQASPPLMNVLWRIPTTDYPTVESLIAQIQTQLRLTASEAGIPSAHPLIVGDIVLMRTLDRLMAVDLRTGKRLWQSQAEDPFEAMAGPVNRDGGMDPLASRQMQYQQLAPSLSVRAWGDTTFGTLSSDGQRVFSVENLDFAIFPNQLRTVIVPLPGGGQRVERVMPRQHNHLAAHDIRTGARLWTLGAAAPGAASEPGDPSEPREDGLRQPASPANEPARASDSAVTRHGTAEATDGCFFLGPPLPLDGRLHVLAERAGQVSLLVVAADSGRLLWELPLVDADRQIGEDPLRRVGGITPSAAGGILVCPTSNKAVIAVDLATRSPLWGFNYAASPPSETLGMLRIYARGGNPDPIGRWVDSSVIIDSEHVIVTPVDSSELYCLRLLDGSLVWKTPRADARYAACVFADKLIVVAAKELRALRLNNGTNAWTAGAVPFPPEASPSGHGFLAGNQYHVPLSNGSILTVDLEHGRTVGVTRSRSGIVPGNLVCHRGYVVSQGPNAVEAFHQMDWLRRETATRLAADPADMAAIALQGQLLWNDRRYDEAIAVLGEALERTGSEKIRDLLFPIFIEAMAEDFDRYATHSDHARRLIRSPEEQASLLRLLAQGYEAQAAWSDAIEAYRLLMRQAEANDELVTIDSSWRVRNSRWIGMRLTACHGAAPHDARTMIEELASRQYQEAMAADGTTRLERFFDSLGHHALAQEAYEELLTRYAAQGDLLRFESLLQTRGPLADPVAERLSPLLRLAETFQTAGDWPSAAACYRWIEAHYPNAVLDDGRTVSRLVEEAVAAEPLKAHWTVDTRWPEGDVKLTRQKLSVPAEMLYGYMNVECAQPRGPFLRGASFQCYSRPDFPLYAYDANGQELWSFPLRDASDPTQFFIGGNTLRISPLGRLLLISSGTRTYMVDTRSLGPEGRPEVLWQRDTAMADMAAAGMSLTLAPMGISRIYHRAVSQDVAVLLPGIACYVDCDRLIGVDPVTGEEQWSRSGIAPGSSLFGDTEFLFVVEPQQIGIGVPYGLAGQVSSRVFRTSDGTELGKRQVPHPRLATVGRNILIWESGVLQGTFSLVDPWNENKSEQAVWRIAKFDHNTRWEILDNELLATLSPAGDFRVFSLNSGQQRFEARLQLPGRSVAELRFWRTPDGYMLFVTQETGIRQEEHAQIYPISGLSSQPVGRGALMAFDREGRPLWDTMTVVQNTYFPIHQPSGAPVLLFGGMIRTQPNQRGQVTTSLWLMGIDRRTGRVVLDKELDVVSPVFRISADPASARMKIETQLETLVLEFSDAPPEPIEHTPHFINERGERPGRRSASQSPAESTKTGETDRGLGEALLNGLGKAILRRVAPSPPEFP